MPVVLADGIGVVDLLVIVCMVAIAVILWSTLQVRGPAGRLPVVGATLVSAIDGMRQAVTQMALSLEAFFSWQQGQVTSLWQRFILQVLNPAVAGFQNRIVGLGIKVEDMANRAIPALQQTVAGLSLTVATIILPQLVQHERKIAATQTELRDAVRPTLDSLDARATRTTQDVTNAIGRLAVLESSLSDALPVLAALAAYFPLLRGLAAFESASAGGVAALGGELTLQRGRVQVLEQDLSKVLGLAGITALGAVAIENLIRVARDPCKGCPGNDLTNNDARIFALEMFGQE